MFNPAYIEFFKELAANNNKEWFQQNKKTYENEVKKPFEQFISALIEEIQKRTPEISITHKEAIFRINRDVRFSADKSPYKTEMSAVISKHGKKGNPCPGLYVSLSAEKAILGFGLKMLEKQQVTDVRNHIAQHADEFEALIHSEAFKSTFGEIQGDKNKRLPEEFRDAAERQPLLYNTSFLAMAEFEPAEITKPDFIDTALQVYDTSLPMASFLNMPVSS